MSLTATRTAPSHTVRDLVSEIEERALRGRIKKARKEAGLTQKQLADLIDVGQRAYQNYEDAGPTGVTPWRLLNAIGKATGTTSEWLLHGDPEDDEQLDRIEARQNEIRADFDRRLDEMNEHIAELRELLASERAAAGASQDDPGPVVLGDQDVPPTPETLPQEETAGEEADEPDAG